MGVRVAFVQQCTQATMQAFVPMQHAEQCASMLPRSEWPGVRALQKASTPKSSSAARTPKTPRTPGGGKVNRELERRLREVIAQRLAFAVAETSGYDLPTRHGQGRHGHAADPALAEAEAAMSADTLQVGLRVHAVLLAQCNAYTCCRHGIQARQDNGGEHGCVCTCCPSSEHSSQGMEQQGQPCHALISMQA